MKDMLLTKVVPHSSPDASGLLRALKLSQLKQIETHQRLRKMKEQLINGLTTIKLITQLQSYDVSLIEDLRKDLRESKQRETTAKQKCEEAEKEIDGLRNELQDMKSTVLRLQRELEIVRNNNGERSVTVLADKEVEDMLRRCEIMSRRSSAQVTSPSFESWTMGRFIEGYVLPTSPPRSSQGGFPLLDTQLDENFDEHNLEERTFNIFPSRGANTSSSLPKSAARLRRAISPSFSKFPLDVEQLDTVGSSLTPDHEKFQVSNRNNQTGDKDRPSSNRMILRQSISRQKSTRRSLPHTSIRR